MRDGGWVQTSVGRVLTVLFVLHCVSFVSGLDVLRIPPKGNYTVTGAPRSKFFMAVDSPNGSLMNVYVAASTEIE